MTEGDAPVNGPAPAVAMDIELATSVFAIVQGREVAPLPRHRHDLPRLEVRRTQTARILASALHLFGTIGFANATIAQIADDAKVSRRTVYDLYPSKEAVFLDTYQCTALLMSHVRTTSPAHAGEAALEEWVGDTLAVVLASPAAANVFFLEATGAGAAVRQRRIEAIAQFVDLVEPAIQAVGRTTSGARHVSRTLCQSLVAATIELVTQHLSGSSAGSRQELVRDIVELFLAVLRPSER